MARVNISLPDSLHRDARRAGLNISQLAQQAIAGELSRRSKIAALDAYLAETEAELGPVGDAEQAEASEWADRAVGRTARSHSA